MAEPMTVGMVLEVDASKVGPKLSAVEGQVNAKGAADFGTAATKRQAEATASLGEKLKGVKKQYGEQIEVVQGLIGKIAAIGGTAVIMYRVGQAIREYIITALATASEKAIQFKDTLDFTDVSGSLTKVQTQIAELESRLAAALESNFSSLLNRLTGDSIASLKQQIAELKRIEANLRGAAEAEKRRKEQEKAAEDARRKAEEDKRKEEEWYDQLRKWQEDQQRKADQTRKAWTDAYRAIREESNRAFATDQAASMVQFAQQMRLEGITSSAANMNRIVVEGVG